MSSTGSIKALEWSKTENQSLFMPQPKAKEAMFNPDVMSQVYLQDEFSDVPVLYKVSFQ